MKKFIVYAGNYGSGKTEISLNDVIFAAQQGKKAVLCDMDIVNPYFRSSEHQGMLESLGIKVIKPCYANTTVDVPSVPPEIFMPFDSECDVAVFDAGGDPVGATALGILKDKFNEHIEQVEFFYVINARRPFQQNAEEICEMLYQIQSSAHLGITGLINNTNLARETTLKDVMHGEEVVKQVSEKTGIPHVYTCVCEDLAAKAQFKNLKPLKIYMRPEWLDGDRA